MEDSKTPAQQQNDTPVEERITLKVRGQDGEELVFKIK